MAKTKIAVAIAILALFQVSCAAARRHGKPAHGDHDGSDASEPAHAPGAASAWLEREEPSAPRGRGLLDLLRFNR